MKRKEQILLVSLELFNEEGEANLSAVDIANEMDISPGNLYYHYHGKSEIVEALFDRYESTIKTLLQEALTTEGKPEDFVALYYALIEQIYLYRFFYRNLNDLLEKYPSIAKRFKKIFTLKRSFCATSLALMLRFGMADPDRVELVGVNEIADTLTMMLTYYHDYSTLDGSYPEKMEFITGCFKKSVSIIGPLAGENMPQAMDYLDQVVAQLALLDTDE